MKMNARTLPWTLGLIGLFTILGAAGWSAWALAGQRPGWGRGLSGVFDQVEGPGHLEFQGSRVYVTTVLGMTFATTYELDGDRVLIRGGGGTQVYTRRGDTLDGGIGMQYIRHQTQNSDGSARRRRTSAGVSEETNP